MLALPFVFNTIDARDAELDYNFTYDHAPEVLTFLAFII